MLLSLKEKKHNDMKNQLGPRKEHNKFKNTDGPKGPKNECFVCGKPDHYARDCKHNKSKNEINVVHANDDIITTMSKIMEIKGKVHGW